MTPRHWETAKQTIERDAKKQCAGYQSERRRLFHPWVRDTEDNVSLRNFYQDDLYHQIDEKKRTMTPRNWETAKQTIERDAKKQRSGYQSERRHQFHPWVRNTEDNVSVRSFYQDNVFRQTDEEERKSTPRHWKTAMQNIQMDATKHLLREQSERGHPFYSLDDVYHQTDEEKRKITHGHWISGEHSLERDATKQLSDDRSARGIQFYHLGRDMEDNVSIESFYQVQDDLYHQTDEKKRTKMTPRHWETAKQTIERDAKKQRSGNQSERRQQFHHLGRDTEDNVSIGSFYQDDLYHQTDEKKRTKMTPRHWETAKQTIERDAKKQRSGNQSERRQQFHHLGRDTEDNVSIGSFYQDDLYHQTDEKKRTKMTPRHWETAKQTIERDAKKQRSGNQSERRQQFHHLGRDTEDNVSIGSFYQDDLYHQTDEKKRTMTPRHWEIAKQTIERDAKKQRSGNQSERRHQFHRLGTTESSSKSTFPDPFEEISVRHATKHGNIRLLRALAAKSNGGLTDFKHTFPLHTAVSLGMKRTTSFLLQSGFDLEERNEFNRIPTQCFDPRNDNVLCEYIRKIDGTDVPLSPPSSHEPNVIIVGKGSCHEETVCIVNMERVDLSTRTVYCPSAQFRSTFKDRDPSRQMFFVSPFLSEYSMVCTYQMFGLLWLLGRYHAEDFLKCLNDIVLPEKNILRCKDGSTGVIDFCTWIKSREVEHKDHDNESSMEKLPGWIRALLQKTSESVRADKIRCDGWTPMHYAVLTRNDELVKQLLNSGEGHLTNKAHSLLPEFILDQLKRESRFEYEFVYSHIEGFTPLMLATFTENQTAIQLIGQCIETLNMFNGKDIVDCLELAYCEDTESNLLDVLCRKGEEHLKQNYHVEVNLQPFYRKKNPSRRILFASSTDVLETIEEDFVAAKIIVENKAIINEYLKTGTTAEVPEKEDKLLAETIRLHSDRLWKRHSSLNAILPGHVSSLPDTCKGYHKSIMVVFHSIDKELIPSSELPFQEYLLTNGQQVLVHVTEGSFKFAPATERTAQVGRSIDYEKVRATLGTFVEGSQKQKGMLTCGHTFLKDFLDKNDSSYDRTFDTNTSSEVLRVYKVEEKRLKIYNEDRTSADDNNTTKPTADDAMEITYPHGGSCGYVKRLLFRPDKEVGIDAALIQFHDDETFTIGPHLHLEHSMAQQQLENQGIQNMDYLQFNNGEAFECTRPVRVLKCGIGTGLTYGVIPFERSTGQVRISDDNFEPMGFSNSKSKHIMKGQLVVKPLVQSTTFFAQGDSGSAVFQMGPGSPGSPGSPLKCIGMGIGYMTKSTDTLVTPIRSVLEAVSEGQETTYTLLTSFDIPAADEGDS
ncbi:uncharacterized protein LOC110445332 isoform X2 [Mizuhopecten yessoensis]|nr:uncharacterized protein LOC110445332 isoform X2 [Mizuhopecten yessoensis]